MVKLFARRGAKVYFTTRSKANAIKALESLSNDPEIKPENITWLIMDLVDLRSIQSAADELRMKERKIDILGM